MAMPRVLHVESEWDRLMVVAMVRPEYFVLTEPINSTQRRFYGTDEQPSASLLVDQHASVFVHSPPQGFRLSMLSPHPVCHFSLTCVMLPW